MVELVVGSRGSELALRQTRWVIDRLEKATPGLICRVEIIRTTGDKVADVPLANMGGRGVFVKEIEDSLIRGDIDIAVHSAKDLPTETPDLLCIGAYPDREDPRDALVSRLGGLADLPLGAVVGTGSVRRGAQILRARPDLEIRDLRGNLDTRLRKLDNGNYDAVMLACAGLKRLGLGERIAECLEYDVCLPAVGQGALAIECRRDSEARGFLDAIDNFTIRARVTAERAFLNALGGGCQAPVAALAEADGDKLFVTGMVISPDGKRIERLSIEGNIEQHGELGIKLAENMLETSAGEILDDARRSVGPNSMGAA